MDIASSATSLLETSVNLLGELKKLYDQNDAAIQGVVSLQSDLEYIMEEINKNKSSETANRSWLKDLRRIKLRIEDAVEFHTINSSKFEGKCAGILAGVVDKIIEHGPRSALIGYIKEIEDLTAAAKNRAKTFCLGEHRSTETTGKEHKAFYHDKVNNPVGLETPVKDVVHMLRDATLLRVVAISSEGTSSGSKLARAAYDEAIKTNEEEAIKTNEKKFSCKAWVTTSRDDDDDDDGNGLIKGILDELGQKPQGDLKDILKDFLKNQRYIIGIDGLETTSTRYWDAVLSAFPDDNMSSRIIITTGKDEIQTCDKKCPIIYRMRARTPSFEGAEAELVQILCKGTKRETRVVTIYGPGGSGKSILAEVANDKIQAEEKFQYKAWGMASHGDGKDLVKHILRQLGKTDLEGKILPELLRILKELLLQERYIVVIDGLETVKDWNDLIYACPDNNKSSRIIVTTTSKEVANVCARDGPIYKMKPLDENYAQDLLASKLVSTKNKCPDDERSVNMRKMVLKTCEGLPLAIANFGDYMQRLDLNSDYGELNNVCISIGSWFVNNDAAFPKMSHVVNRSHTSLDDDVKACFLSLSIYSNNLVINDRHDIVDNPIKAKPLIRRLLAEGLISPKEGVAEKCFSQLIEYNFIVPLKFSISGQVKTFRVNRMMPQFINVKGDDENYVTRIYTQMDKQVKSHTDITRLCLHNESAEFPGFGGKVVDLSHVRLLTFHGKANKALMDFNGYTFLRVLILEKCENMKDEHLNTIGSQQMLRYLSIRDNEKVKKLPDNIMKMQSLETLDTRGTSVHEISMDVIIQLTKLLHLFGQFQITVKKSLLEKLPGILVPADNNIPSIEKSKLQTLAGFFIDESPDFVTLLPRMHKLRKVKILSRKIPPPKVITNKLLKSLLIRPVGKEDRNSQKEEEKEGLNSPFHSLSIESHVWNLDFLDGLKIEPPRPLLSLKLCGKLTKLPRFLLSFSDSLKELCLSETSLGGTVLSELQDLKTLQFLKLMGHHFEPEETLTFESSWFCHLQRLCFDVKTVPNIVIKKNAMKGLNSLQLLCEQLGRVSGILYLDQLEEVILPSKVSGQDADNLLEQVRQHSKKPKILDDDGSSRQISKFSRSFAFNEKTKFETGPSLSRMDGFKKSGNTEESDGDGSSPLL